MHTLDDGVIAELRTLSGTKPQILQDEELLRMVLPAIRGDYRAVETYRCEPGATVRCPVTVLTGDADPRTSLAEARAWSEHTEAGSDLRIFSGGHFFLSERPAEVLAVLGDQFAVPGLIPSRAGQR